MTLRHRLLTTRAAMNANRYQQTLAHRILGALITIAIIALAAAIASHRSFL